MSCLRNVGNDDRRRSVGQEPVDIHPPSNGGSAGLSGLYGLNWWLAADSSALALRPKMTDNCPNLLIEGNELARYQCLLVPPTT